MNILNGKELSSSITSKLKKDVLDFQEKTSRRPCLAVVLVGDDQASKTYTNMKARACKEVGIQSILHEMSEDVSEQILLQTIENMNNDITIDGILVQLPLPKHLNENKIIEKISAHKDVDGFTPFNVGSLWSNVNKNTMFAPATPLGVIKLLKHNKIDIQSKEVVIVGTSNIVGKPLAGLFLQENATVTMCNIHTKNLISHTLRADILCVGIGKPNFITADMVKDNVVVIDIGINKVDGKLCGDVDFKEVSKKASYITPVPGGVGPMTISILLENTIRASKNYFKGQINE